MADEREPEGWAGLRRRVRRFLVAALVLSVLALVAGLVLGRFFPRLVATRSIAPLVLSEAVGDPDARVTTGPAPSSGPVPTTGEVTCGVVPAPVPPTDQVATLAAGVVVLHVATDGDPALTSAARELVDDGDVLVVDGTTGLQAPVEAVAWGRRLRLEPGTDPRLLDRFLLAYLDTGPERGGCPGPGS